MALMHLYLRYSYPHSLWEVKTGLVVRDNEKDEAKSHGISHEPVVRKLYMEVMGCVVVSSPFKNHSDPAWSDRMGAEPDGNIPLSTPHHYKE